MRLIYLIKNWHLAKSNDLQAEFHSVFTVIGHHLMVANQIALTTGGRPKSTIVRKTDMVRVETNVTNGLKLH